MRELTIQKTEAVSGGTVSVRLSWADVLGPIIAYSTPGGKMPVVWHGDIETNPAMDEAA
jgi:hypothetical protein